MSKKPTLKTEMIERKYWQCNMPKHRHLTEQVAATCMGKLTGMGKKHASDLLSRNIAATRRVLEGETFNGVGKDIGISNHRVDQIYRQILRKIFYIYKDEIISKEKALEEHDKGTFNCRYFGDGVIANRSLKHVILPWLDRYEKESAS